MKMLSKDGYTRSYRFIQDTGRELEQGLCCHHFTQPCPERILAALKSYQNADGGFGNALEPDFRLPDSSPLATSIGLRLLQHFDSQLQAIDMIKASVRHLEATYVPGRTGWFAVPRAVNSHPHTPWWHHDPQKGMTIIDEHWGNPTAELIGYLHKYREHVTGTDLDRILNYAIDNLDAKEAFVSFHEIFCYIRLYTLLPQNQAARLQDRLTEAVHVLTCLDPNKWESEYLPTPLDFVGESEYAFDLSTELIGMALDHFVARLEQKGHLVPSWGRAFYKEGLEPAWDEWQAKLTLDMLILLDRYDRLDT